MKKKKTKEPVIEIQKIYSRTSRGIYKNMFESLTVVRINFTINGRKFAEIIPVLSEWHYRKRLKWAKEKFETEFPHRYEDYINAV